MNIKSLLLGLGVVTVAGFSLAACQAPTPTAPVEEMPIEETEVMPEEVSEPMDGEIQQNIVETAAATGQFQTLIRLATVAGLAEALSTDNLTLFAPTDEAFAALPAATLAELQADPAKLAEVLKAHVVLGAMPSVEVVAAGSVETLGGQTLPVIVKGEKVMIGDAVITQADITAKNGVIHVIDKVIIPEVEAEM